MDRARVALREVFGFDDFRPVQRDVIQSVLSGTDTLAIMPTGGGKSLCYQLPALLLDGLTVVVSPLISLMQDQVRQLSAAGVPAVVLNSSLDGQTYRENMGAVRGGRAKLLYLAPETLFKSTTMGLLQNCRVALLAIDEAHCISQWGHDFRPEYRRLAEIRSEFPGAVCIGLTATATPRVRDDIAQTLGFAQSARFVASFDRPNLLLRVQTRDAPLAQLLALVSRHEGRSGIVYCSSRKRTEAIAAKLSQHGLRAAAYHAGLPDEERRTTQERFVRDDIDIIVATVAFGMGIDKPDVRFVAHHDLPQSLESYYQEIGRAGRDGLPAECLLLLGLQDLGTIEYFIQQKSDAEQRIARLQLSRMLAYAESTLCRRRPLLDYFGEAAAEGGCQNCDICQEPQPALTDITVEAQKFLSCVYRSGQVFGAGHVIDILRGSKNQKVIAKGHDRLSTYGVGKDHDAKQWRHIARQLVQLNLVEQDPTHGGLRLGENAGAVLRGETPVQGRIRASKSARASRAKRSGRKAAAAHNIPHDEVLFERLRAVRKALANEAGVPPYVIFPDRTLIEMAAQQPTTENELLSLHGVGATRLARWGGAFLQAIKDNDS
jgi:ATP-dependent DNA helicase RecQ